MWMKIDRSKKMFGPNLSKDNYEFEEINCLQEFVRFAHLATAGTS